MNIQEICLMDNLFEKFMGKYCNNKKDVILLGGGGAELIGQLDY